MEEQESDTERIIGYMKEIGKAVCMARLELAVIITLRLRSLVAREACRQQMENALVNMSLAFGEIGKATARQKNGGSCKDCSLLSW